MFNKITMGLAVTGALLVGAPSATLAGDLCKEERVERRHHYHGHHARVRKGVEVDVHRGHRHHYRSHHRHHAYHGHAGPRMEVRVKRGHRHHYGASVQRKHVHRYRAGDRHGHR